MKKLIDELSGLERGGMVAERRDVVSGGGELGDFHRSTCLKYLI